MNPLTIIFSITLSILNSAYSEPHIPTAGLALATGPPSLGDSSVHYAYNRHLDYGHHYVEPVRHHVSYSTYPNNVVDLFGVIHPVPGFYGHEVVHTHDGYGYGHGHAVTVKHGYKENHHFGDHGYEHEIKQEHHHGFTPFPSGYVPTHGKAVLDHGIGYAVGHDAIGHFDHHTGPFGPFGFYANYYHD